MREEREKRRKIERETSLSNLGKSDYGFSLEQKVKSIHASRATVGYQNIGVSSNFTR